MSLEFDTDRVSLGSASSVDNLFNGGATLMAWVRPVTVGGGSVGRVFDKAHFIFHANNSSATNTWTFEHMRAGTTGRWRMPSSSISFDAWQHVTVTYDGSSTSNDPALYLDGVAQTVTEMSTPTSTINADGSSTLYLGNRSDSTRPFDGRIADARFYNRILSAGEVATIVACRGHDGIVSGLAGRWPCDELSPGTALGSLTDVSGNANSGTPSGTPLYQDHPLSFRRRV